MFKFGLGFGVCHAQGSRFVSHPLSAYDLYLTAAVTDGVKLWDLRADRWVGQVYNTE